MTIYHCPVCGAPVNESGDDVMPIPANYKPEDYAEGQVCYSCQTDMAYQEYKEDLLWYHARMAEDDSY